MTDVPDSPGKSSGLEALREELADEFLRVAAVDGKPAPKAKLLSGRRRLVAPVVALLLVPASFAVAKGLDGNGSITFEEAPAFVQALEEAGLSWDGENIRRDGRILNCPVDEALRKKLGFDPCTIMTPAPAPSNE